MSSAPSRPPAPPSTPPSKPRDDDSTGSPQNGSSPRGKRPGQTVFRGAREPLGTALLALCAAGIALFMTSGPLWLTVAGMVAAVAAFAFGVLALVRIRRTQRRFMIVVSVLVAMVISGFSLLTGGVRLAFWDTVSAYEECVSQSVTISSKASCQNDMEKNLRGLLLPGTA